MPRRRQDFSLASAFTDLRTDYSAAKASRFRRVRRGLSVSGSGADYHYRSESDYLRMMEYARDMDRNDAIAGATINRAVENEIQDGFTLDADTGDRSLDADLEARLKDWMGDPQQCDFAAENNFFELESLVSRAVKVDGDIVALGTEEGSLQLIEAHRIRTPHNTKKNVVHGFLLDERRRRKECWITRDDIDPHAALNRVSDITAYPIRDADGHRQIFHVYNPKRATQTRGVTAFAPVFDLLSMIEDINFAKLVQQQVVSCFAIFRMREDGDDNGQSPAHGEQTTERLADGSTRTIEGIAPGMELTGLPGERLEGFSPSVPNSEYFEQVKLILTLIGVNLGMPLVIVLLDAKETNFSGWRGAVDQARMGFRRNQHAMIERFHRPIYQWKLRQWIAEDPAIRAAAQRSDIDIFRHVWNRPTWPYIEPMKDAQADALRIEKRLISPRRLHAERGREYHEIANEIIADNVLLATAALEAAAQLNSRFPEARIDWRELAGFEAKATPSAPPESDDDGEREEDEGASRRSTANTNGNGRG